MTEEKPDVPTTPMIPLRIYAGSEVACRLDPRSTDDPEPLTSVLYGRRYPASYAQGGRWVDGAMIALPAPREVEDCGCNAEPYGGCSASCREIVLYDFGTAAIDMQHRWPAPTVSADPPPLEGWDDLEGAERYFTAGLAAVAYARRLMPRDTAE